MPHMIELIRSSSVPATIMQSAARGALSVPAPEMIEILVHLANHNPIFGQAARITLAGWDEKACLAAASDSSTPQEVLQYFIALENLRPRLLPALLENPAISDTTLDVIAATGPREVVEAMRQSPRVQKSPAILHALTANPNATQSETAQLHDKLVASGFESAPEEGPEPSSEASLEPREAASTAVADEQEEAVSTYLAEHAKEIAADEGKPFQPLGGMYELESSATEPQAASTPSPSPGDALVGTATAETPAGNAPATGHAKTATAAKKAQVPRADERGSVLQRIAKLDIKGRIQMAMKGSKEERSILIRDGTKLVALAVLESGKITDGEVEKFASQKNVLEAVLRQIPMKRRFIKNYNVVRNLVANPRTPIDVSLGLMKNLLVADLRNLSSNKEVSETIRKLALKMFKQKTDTSKKQSG
ncbi:MAG TPA: hypothetical protein VNY29_04535 [Terriglobales bacterium]|nr:hypothetical protein [Terriglobales bacterium]